jgi:uncharacterized damage-inducible protein DinB
MKLTMILAFASALLAQAPPTVARLYDGPLANVERELVALAEAMPAEKFNFAPKEGSFATVRTFGEQARHIATVNYMCAAAVLKEKSPVEAGPKEEGPEANRTKEQIVQYLKDSFAYAHKAMNSITAGNQLEMVSSPFGPGQMARGDAASIPTWHSFDHYGQMVVYARMNGVVPPASQPAPPPPPVKKK